MTERAWTLGNGPSYEQAVRIPRNAKAPGGIVFRTREAAVRWRDDHADDPGYAQNQTVRTWKPYEIELPNSFMQDTSANRHDVWMAYHDWHSEEREEHPAVSYDWRCGICEGLDTGGLLPNLALLVEARFVNPDTGELA